MRLPKTEVGQELYAPDTKNVIPAKAGIQNDLRTAILRFALTFICCSLGYIFLSALAVMAENTTTVPLKDWWEYTDEEKEFLEDRWTEEKVETIVKALKVRKPMPDFVDTLPSSEEMYYYDLRRIRLSGDLPAAHLEYTYLQGARLVGATLSVAWLSNANLQGANLLKTNLQRSGLQRADLQEAILWGTELQGAYLTEAKLQGADLLRASLQGAKLRGANVQGADLYRTCMDTTYLWSVNLGQAKNIRYIIWGDTIQPRYFIGEEKLADSTKTEEDFRDAEITYRDLKSFYEKELMYDIAAEFHFRENEVKTRRYFYQNPFIWFSRTVFLRLTYGYGSRPWRLLWYSLGVIGLFTVVFYVLALFPRARVGIYVTKQGDTRKKRLTWRQPHECLYFSLLAFATFGYGAMRPRQWLQLFRMKLVEHEPVGWIRIFVGLEAALGIWVLALLVTVLFGK